MVNSYQRHEERNISLPECLFRNEVSRTITFPIEFWNEPGSSRRLFARNSQRMLNGDCTVSKVDQGTISGTDPPASFWRGGFATAQSTPTVSFVDPHKFLLSWMTASLPAPIAEQSGSGGITWRPLPPGQAADNTPWGAGKTPRQGYPPQAPSLSTSSAFP